MKTWDVFISHASEDKEEIATPLYHRLKELGLKVWYDEQEIQCSDEIVNKISYGLENTTYFIIILSPNFIKKDKIWTDAENKIIQYLQIQDSKKIIPIYNNLTPKNLNHKFLFVKHIASIDAKKESFSNYTTKISKTIFEANIKRLLTDKIEINELKKIALKYIPSLNTIRDEIYTVGINQELMIEVLFGLNESFIPILQEVTNKKNIKHTNIGNYIKLLTDDKELQSNDFYLSNKTDVDVKENFFFTNKYLIFFFSLILIGFLIFQDFGEANTTKSIEKMEIENKGETLYIEIENLLTLSDNLLSEYLEEPLMQTKVTIEELSKRIEQKKDVILNRSEKYIKIKDSYQLLIVSHRDFLKSCQKKSFVFSRMQKIDINLRNLRVSIETLKSIYDSEMLNFKVLKKQLIMNKMQKNFQDNISIVSVKTEKTKNSIEGKLK